MTPLLPTAEEIYRAVRRQRPRGHREFTEAHALRSEEVLRRQAARVQGDAPPDFDALTKDVLRPEVGSVLGIVIVWALSALGQHLATLAIRWALEWGWNRGSSPASETTTL